MNHLFGVEAKLERAREHVDNSRHKIEIFEKSRPYQIRARRDADSRRVTYYLESVVPVPADIAATAGDAIQSLRTILDYVAYEFMCIKHGRVGPFRVYFPMYGSAAEYHRDEPKKRKPFREDHLWAIDALRPYKGANDILWQIDRLNIIDKHRLLFTAAGSYQGFDAMRTMLQVAKGAGAEFTEMAEALSSMKLFLRPADKLFPLKPGDALYTDAPDADVDEHMEFMLPVSIREEGVIEPEPLASFLSRALAFVLETVDLFLPLMHEHCVTRGDMGYP